MFFGGIISALGLLLCSFATEFYMVLLSFGILAGTLPTTNKIILISPSTISVKYLYMDDRKCNFCLRICMPFANVLRQREHSVHNKVTTSILNSRSGFRVGVQISHSCNLCAFLQISTLCFRPHICRRSRGKHGFSLDFICSTFRIWMERYPSAIT